MSHLDDLIRQLCPDGVPYKTLGEVLPRVKGTPITAGKMKEIATLNGDIRIFAGGKTVIDTELEKIPNANIINKPAILVQSRGVIDFIYYDKPFTFKNEMWAYIGVTNVSLKFIYYVLKSNVDFFRNAASGMGSLPQISLHVTEDFRIPVPPLPVQEEIVRILDAFTTLEAELEAELEARRRQYEYYLNYILDLSVLTPQKIMYVGDLFEIKNGLNKEKSAFGHGTPIVNFTDVYNKRFLTAAMLQGKVSLTDSEIERYRVRKGDVFFTRTSETKEDVGMSSTVIEDIPNCTFSGFVLRARPLTNLLLPKFCSYYFSTKQVRNNIVRYASFTTRATTCGPKLAKIPVPIIPIEEQSRIVGILDRFDTLCNDLCQGLPAEIAARHRQYEYYRDRLLSFKEAKG
ncbi:MAG: restriction endonuclease subunit S [Lentisphaeria bacterium]|nr:restriction endonuclease subunit S [Lentisphaeria bacterium]